MTKQEALDLIDAHKKDLFDPLEMLQWTYLRVIVLNIPDQAWEEALSLSHQILSR